MNQKVQIKKPKLSDGPPEGYEGNNHLWYLKQLKKWLRQNEEGYSKKSSTTVTKITNKQS
jgi:hypothetical protein